MAAQTDRGVPLSSLAPKFLHTNSTSHTWPFSAIAELIDNAYDPDVSAKQFWIDKTVVKGQECLTFMDNGNGLDNESMHKMLSFGYSDKIALNGLEPIGIYGNGFKSGSMRLGKDAIVFSKSAKATCVGMLSQTYLKKIDAQQIIVPIVCFEAKDDNDFFVRDEHKASLQDILRYSPFNTQKELLAEIEAINSPWSTEKTGTRIIIWNLRSTSFGTSEFDFESDRYDIQIPSELYGEINGVTPHSDRVPSYTPETMFSLRAYCSILYLKPRMQIVVRGVKVKSQLIAKSLACIRKDHYKPQVLNGKRISITFGYNTKSKEQYGIMMYHKNRLIKAYERVGCQLKADKRGVGVIGVIECNFLEPTHNKQSFLESDKYRKTINSLGIKLEEYWQEIRYRRKKENPYSKVPVEDTMKRPDQNWVQCDGCLRWRKLPDGINYSKLPDKWFCRMNPDPQFRSCHVDEEPEDSDDDQPTYRKTYKEQEREDRRKEMNKQKVEEDRRRQEEEKKCREEEKKRREEEEKLAELAEAVRLQQENLQWQLSQTTPYLPPATTSASSQGGAAKPASSPQIVKLSQAVRTPSFNDGFPVISNVCSLSTVSQGVKRQNPVIPQTPKRPKLNGLHDGSAATPASVSSPSSPSVPVISDDEDTDDDLVILENASTPKPPKTRGNIANKKIEKQKSEESNASISILMVCTDDAAVEDASEAKDAGSGSAGGDTPSPAPAPLVSNTTTQTEVPQVKVEDLSQDQMEEEVAMPSTCNEKNDRGEESESDPSKVERNGDDGSEIKVSLQNGENREVEADAYDDNEPPPVNFPNPAELQMQQDQLLELMQDTARERDALKEQVHELTCRLQDMEEQMCASVKKECSHQHTQTDETDEVKQEATQNETDQHEEMDAEIALQADRLLQEVDEINKKKDELLSQVESLKKEKEKMATQCEELELSLQKRKGKGPVGLSSGDSSVQPSSDEEEASTSSGAPSSADALKSLIELRHNIGRILVHVVPELDLGQVNYQCNVIDELLEDLINNQDSLVTLTKQLNANND